jgi:hypothetical protein
MSLSQIVIVVQPSQLGADGTWQWFAGTGSTSTDLTTPWTVSEAAPGVTPTLMIQRVSPGHHNVSWWWGGAQTQPFQIGAGVWSLDLTLVYILGQGSIEVTIDNGDGNPDSQMFEYNGATANQEHLVDVTVTPAGAHFGQRSKASGLRTADLALYRGSAGSGNPAKKPLSTGAIIGITLGVLAAVGLAAWGVKCLRDKRAKTFEMQPF